MKASRFGLIFLFLWGFLPPMTVSSFVVTPPPRPSLSGRRQSLAPLKMHSSWKSHVSTDPDASTALSEVLDELSSSSSYDDEPPQLAFLFVGPTHASSFEALVKQACAALPSECRLLSIVGGGTVGGTVECDEPSKPSISLLAGRIPKDTTTRIQKDEDDDVPLNFFSFNELTDRPPPVDSEYWNLLANGDGTGSTTSRSGARGRRSASYILFADPWAPMNDILDGLSYCDNDKNDDTSVVVGGISVPTTTRPTVAIDDKPLPQGSAVGVAFPRTGHLGIQAVVTQGCRPIGPVYTVTSVQNNCIRELDSQPALETLEAFVRQASVQEQRQLGSGLVCGILVSNHNNDDTTTTTEDDACARENADYLIRQIKGYVPSKSGIAIAGSRVKVGDRVRFHVRDKTAARDDLQLMVQRAKTERLFQEGGSTASPILAALQISCVARGRSLFGTPNVDLSNIQELATTSTATTTSSWTNGHQDGTTDAAPIAGFFANGEIGPVGVAGFSSSGGGSVGGTHLHGFTTVVALLCDYSAALATAGSSDDDGHASLDDEPVVAWE